MPNWDVRNSSMDGFAMTTTRRGEDMIDVMVSLMRNKFSSTHLVILAAEMIAAEARLSLYLANAKKNRGNDAEIEVKLFEILDFHEELMNECVSVRRELEGGMDIEKVCVMLREAKERLERHLGILNDK